MIRLSALSSDQPQVAMVVSGAARHAEDLRPASAMKLRRDFLRIDLRRIERQMRAARQDEDFTRLKELSSEHQLAKTAMGEAIGSAP